MKSFLCIVVALSAVARTALADDHTLRSALRDLPPKYLADIPSAHREKLLKAVGEDSERMDAASGWLHWFSDGRAVRASSMLWAKELPRTGKSSLILVHMAKPFASGGEPEKNQTFVLERTEDGWVDRTEKVMPAKLDLTMHFRTRREDTVVEVAPWKQIDRADGRGKAWVFGSRVMDLHWSGERFVARKPKSDVLTKN